MDFVISLFTAPMRSFYRRAILVALILFPGIVLYLAFRLSEETRRLAVYTSSDCQCGIGFENRRKDDGSEPEHRLCVVIPFRNRFEELLALVPHLNTFLKRNRRVEDFRFLVINQMDKYRFNRASLVNVGFYESQRLKCDYFAMHDVDLLPLNDDLDYGYPSAGPYHVSAPKYHPRYHYKTFIGGILLIRLDHYQSVNGMSNRYWGWGLEDDEFYLRLRSANLTIYRPKGLKTNSSSTFRHLHESGKRPRDMALVGDQEKETKKRDKVTGLKSVKYEVVGRSNMTVDGAFLTVVHVKLFCDKRLTPWCELHEQ